MKKVVVVSDNHGDQKILQTIRETEKADYYLHLGDSEAYKTEDLRGYICVKGNNDYDLDLPFYATLQVEDLLFLMHHGHFYGYADREMGMRKDAIKYGADIVLSGHTHMPLNMQDEDRTYINPGSITLPRGGSKRSYCVIIVDGNQFSVSFKELNAEKSIFQNRWME